MKTGLYMRLLVLLIAFAWLGGCASGRPDPRMPEPAGPLVQVDGESLPSIEFFKVRTDIPGGRVLGFHYEGIDDRRVHDYRWDESFENVTTVLNDRARGILEESGYRLAYNGGGEVFMKGVMRKVSYNSFDRKISFTQAEMEVRWELFRPGEDKPFHTFATLGAGRVDNIDSGAMVQALELALRRLLADPEFSEALKPAD